MEVLVLNEGIGRFEFKDIENTLEEIQEIVGGYIEAPFLTKVFTENGIDVIINDEGKFIEGLKPSIIVLQNGTNRTLDVIMGNCVFVSHDTEGNTIELNEKQIDIILNVLEYVTDVTDKENNTHTVRILYV